MNYTEQAVNNISCLYDEPKYCERKETLMKLNKELTKHNVNWALACSMNLFLRGIVDEFHDIDMIVDRDSVETIKKIMENIDAKLVDTGGNGYCESDVYLHYVIGRVDVDVISNFRVKTYGTEYVYRYNANELDRSLQNMPLIPAEALYVLYAMMEGWQPKRRFKRLALEEFLKENTIHPGFLAKESVNGDLPSWIRWQIKSIIE